MLRRPCFLVIDSEHAHSISSRKLVLETAKYNVITAYSCEEAVETLQRFPGVDAVVFNSLLGLKPGYPELAAALAAHEDVKVVVVGDATAASLAHRVDAQVEGFAPPLLLTALRQMFPASAQQILEHDASLEVSGED